MSRVYKLAELLQDAGFCDYIQDWAVRTGRTYSEVYDKILDDNMFCESVIDGWIKSGGML
jgi:hypothetical protein